MSVQENLRIDIQASDWTTVDDFYDAVLPPLGAPKWHGRNLNALLDSILMEGVNAVFAALRAPEWHGDSVNALVESIVWGEINELEPPYRIEVVNSHAAPAPIRQELRWTQDGVTSAKADRKRRQGVEPDVWFEIRS